MAERVVDHLEAIEIEEQHRDDAVRTPCPMQRHPHLVEKELPVGEPRERVVVRDLLDLRRGVHRRLPLLLEQPDDESHREAEVQHDVDETERGEPEGVEDTDIAIGRQREEVDLVRRDAEEGERHGAAADRARDSRRAADRPRREERGKRDEDTPRRHAKLVDHLAVGRVPPEQRRQQCAEQGGPDDDASHRLLRERLARRQLEGPEKEPRELQAPRDPRHHRDRGVRHELDRPADEDDPRQCTERGVRCQGEPAPRPVTQERPPVPSLQPDEHPGDDQRRTSLNEQAGHGHVLGQRHLEIWEKAPTNTGDALCSDLDDQRASEGTGRGCRCVRTGPPPKVGDAALS